MADRDRGRKSSKKKGGSESDDDYNDDEELQNLPETQREMIIAERLEKKERETRKKQTLDKNSLSKPSANPKHEALSQLHSKRQSAKDRRERIAAENRDESEDGSYSESDGEISNKRNKRRGGRDDDEDYVDDDEKKLRNKPEKKRKLSQERSPEKSQTITMEVLEKVRVSRKNIALLLSHSIFEKTIIGSFVRVNQSSGQKGPAQASAHDYAIAQVVGVQPYKKNYQVDDKETNKILILKHGSKERPMKMCFISNGEFTGAEFTKWINRMQRESQKIPTIDEIETKEREIQRGLKYRYTNDDIRKNIDHRIQEKLKNGEPLMAHEIEILENKRIQKEREYWNNNKDMTAKKELEKLEDEIKRARALLKAPKSATKKEAPKNVAMEMEEMFKDEEEEEEEKTQTKGKGKAKEEEDDDQMIVEEEDEEEKASREKMLEEMKTKGLTMTDMYNQMKRDFIKNHKVDLAIDSIIDEWNIETEVA